MKNTQFALSNNHIRNQLISKRKSALGFSLLELLVSVALLGVLLATATPSFANIIERSKLRATSLKVSESLALARSAAVSQNRIVLLCHFDQQRNCIASNKRNKPWEHGWQIFTDLNENNEFDGNDTILATMKPNSSVSVIFNQNGRLRFFPDGSARSAGFYICGSERQATVHLKLLHTGRSRVAKSASEKAQSVCKSSL